MLSTQRHRYSRKKEVEGVSREALIQVPAKTTRQATPLLFVFPGHGGTMELSAARAPFHALWPEAIGVIRREIGRDLKFFDAMWTTLRKEYRVDETRIYVADHSNGGAFTYLLWATRPELFAGVAPTSAAALRLLGRLTPKPAFIAAGENDPLVKFAWQQATLDAVLRIDQCGQGESRENMARIIPQKLDRR